MNWICGYYQQATRSVQIWPEGEDHNVEPKMFPAACWCFPEMEIQPNGAFVVVHKRQAGTVN